MSKRIPTPSNLLDDIQKVICCISAKLGDTGTRPISSSIEVCVDTTTETAIPAVQTTLTDPFTNTLLVTKYHDTSGNDITDDIVAIVDCVTGPVGPAPLAPTNLVATAGEEQVVLTWTASANTTSYRVYYQNGTFVGSTGGTTYTDTGLTGSVEYFYYVVAVFNGASSPASNIDSATPTGAVGTFALFQDDTPAEFQDGTLVQFQT